MKRVVLVLCLFASSIPEAAPSCKAEAQPKITLAPMRYLRVKVTIEDRAGGELLLVGAEGVETSSLVNAGPRTSWVEWKNIVLVPGEYEVQLLAGKCTARDTVVVSGGDGLDLP